MGDLVVGAGPIYGGVYGVKLVVVVVEGMPNLLEVDRLVVLVEELDAVLA